MGRWLERLAVLVVLLLTVGVIWACWLPAKVGVTPNDRGAPWERGGPGRPFRGGPRGPR